MKLVQDWWGCDVLFIFALFKLISHIIPNFTQSFFPSFKDNFTFCCTEKLSQYWYSSLRISFAQYMYQNRPHVYYSFVSKAWRWGNFSSTLTCIPTVFTDIVYCFYTFSNNHHCSFSHFLQRNCYAYLLPLNIPSPVIRLYHISSL